MMTTKKHEIVLGILRRCSAEVGDFEPGYNKVGLTI
jgi:hypothetical protein